MFLGHYGVALAAKGAAPRVSLGTAILAAQLLDLIWPLLLLLGVEEVRIVPGLMAASALDFVHYPISHSLIATVAWAVVAAGAYFAWRRSRAGALIVGIAVLSHWLLDAPMHRPDLPLWPGSDILVGGGLWNSLPATLAIELAVLGAGFWVYARWTTAVDRIGRWGLIGGVAALVLFFLSSLTAPPPGEAALAWGGLTLWLFVPWGYWVDRHRRTAGAATADRVPAIA